MALIEFYLGSSPGIVATVNDAAVPRAGEFVNIRKITYIVGRVTWAVDYPDAMGTKLRANVELDKTDEKVAS